MPVGISIRFSAKQCCTWAFCAVSKICACSKLVVWIRVLPGHPVWMPLLSLSTLLVVQVVIPGAFRAHRNLQRSGFIHLTCPYISQIWWMGWVYSQDQTTCSKLRWGHRNACFPVEWVRTSTRWYIVREVKWQDTRRHLGHISNKQLVRNR